MSCFLSFSLKVFRRDLKMVYSPSVWPDWEIYWTLGNFSKPLETINLPKSPTFLGNFCLSFLGNFLLTFGDSYLVTLFTFARQLHNNNSCCCRGRGRDRRSGGVSQNHFAGTEEDGGDRFELDPVSPLNAGVFTGTCGQSYKGSTIVNYSSIVIIGGIFKSGTTLES